MDCFVLFIVKFGRSSIKVLLRFFFVYLLNLIKKHSITMAAPKGNKFAVGIGTKKKFESVDDLETEIEKYFLLCDTNVLKVDKDGNITTEPYTIEGLALSLGCTYQTLLNYEKTKGYEVYFEAIKMAKLKIQKDKVVNMLSGKSNAAGSIFDLKNNHGYKDKQEHDINAKVESTKITQEERAARIAELTKKLK